MPRQQMKFKYPDSYPMSPTIESIELLDKPNGAKKPRTMYACDLCHKEFTSKRLLGIHVLNIHHTNPFKCGLCDERFKWASSVARHELIHSQTRLFECPHCATSFTQSGSMNRHIRDSCTFKSSSNGAATSLSNSAAKVECYDDDVNEGQEPVLNPGCTFQVHSPYYYETSSTTSAKSATLSWNMYPRNIFDLPIEDRSTLLSTDFMTRKDSIPGYMFNRSDNDFNNQSNLSRATDSYLDERVYKDHEYNGEPDSHIDFTYDNLDILFGTASMCIP